LLERSRGGAKATPQGAILYQASREIIDKYQDVEAELQHSCDVVGGHLRVAIVYSVGLHELPAYMKEYLRSYPDVNVHVEYSRPNKIYENVIAQHIDLGIVAYPQKHPQIVTIPIREDMLVLACPPGHRLAGAKKVRLVDLEGEPFVAYEKDIATRKATDQLLRNSHVTVEYVAEYDNIETIKRAVEIGQGVAIVPLPAIRHEVEKGTIRIADLAEENLSRPLGIIHKRGRHLSPAAERFIEVVKREDLGD
jgi:DNA-binding transcriptional LysR family regulator